MSLLLQMRRLLPPVLALWLTGADTMKSAVVGGKLGRGQPPSCRMPAAGWGTTAVPPRGFCTESYVGTEFYSWIDGKSAPIRSANHWARRSERARLFWEYLCLTIVSS